jgi:hypothetical protein
MHIGLVRSPDAILAFRKNRVFFAISIVRTPPTPGRARLVGGAEHNKIVSRKIVLFLQFGNENQGYILVGSDHRCA